MRALNKHSSDTSSGPIIIRPVTSRAVHLHRTTISTVVSGSHDIRPTAFCNSGEPLIMDSAASRRNNASGKQCAALFIIFYRALCALADDHSYTRASRMFRIQDISGPYRSLALGHHIRNIGLVYIPVGLPHYHYAQIQLTDFNESVVSDFRIGSPRVRYSTFWTNQSIGAFNRISDIFDARQKILGFCGFLEAQKPTIDAYHATMRNGIRTHSFGLAT